MKWIVGTAFLVFSFMACMLVASWFVEGTTAIVLVALLILILCVCAALNKK